MSLEDGRFGVRTGQFVPDAPAVTIHVDGYPVLTGREFGDVNDYTEHEAGEYVVAVRETDTDETLLEETLTFENGAYHTLLVVGTVADPAFELLTDGQSG